MRQAGFFFFFISPENKWGTFFFFATLEFDLQIHKEAKLNIHVMYRNILKFRTPGKIAVIILKLEQYCFTTK